MEPHQLGRQRGAVAVSKVDVNEGDVVLETRCERSGNGQRAGFADDAAAPVREDLGETATSQFVVLDEEDSERCGHVGCLSRRGRNAGNLARSWPLLQLYPIFIT